jgi:hypothetical protein
MLYPNIPVTDTGFWKIKIEITTATAPFAFPRTYKQHTFLNLNVEITLNSCSIMAIANVIIDIHFHHGIVDEKLSNKASSKMF